MLNYPSWINHRIPLLRVQQLQINLQPLFCRQVYIPSRDIFLRTVSDHFPYNDRIDKHLTHKMGNVAVSCVWCRNIGIQLKRCRDLFQGWIDRFQGKVDLTYNVSFILDRWFNAVQEWNINPSCSLFPCRLMISTIGGNNLRNRYGYYIAISNYCSIFGNHVT